MGSKRQTEVGFVARFATLVAAVVIILSTSIVVHAGNSRSFLLGNEAAITGGAGGALMRQSEAVWYNPAGIGGMDTGKLDISGSAFVLRLGPLRSMAVTTMPSGVYHTHMEANQYLSVPTSLVKVRKVSDVFSLALGIFVPVGELFSSKASLQTTENLLGMTDVEAIEGLELHYQHFRTDIGATFAWQPAERFRIGFTLFFVYDALKYTRMIFVRMAGLLGDENASAFGYNNDRLDLSYVGIKTVLGIQWEFVQDWHLGIVVRSPTFTIYRWGDRRISATSVGMDGNFESPAYFEHTIDRVKHWHVEMTEPMEISVSLGFQRPGGWIGVEAGVTLPWTNEEFDIRRHVQWNLSVGGKLALSKSILAGLGLFTDRSPSKVPRKLGEMDVDYYGVSGGFEYLKAIGLKNKASSIVFSTTIAGRAAYGTGHFGGMTYNGGDSRIVIRPVHGRFLDLSLHLGGSMYF